MFNTIEENEKKYSQGEISVMISMGEDDKQAENLSNAILSLGAVLKSKWTSRQKQVIYTYLMSGDNQYKAADILKIGQSSVNKALNTIKYYTFKMALINTSYFLGQLEIKSH